MIVLGLFAFGTNPGACLLRDGRLLAFAEEERFARVKGAPGAFPGGAVAFCLRRGGIELGEVDRIAFGWDAHKYPYRMLGRLAWQLVRWGGGSGGAATSALSYLVGNSPGHIRDGIRLGLRAHGVAGEVPEIEFVAHHLCHAYSAYFCSPFEDALVLTFDGSGEDVCTQVATGSGERLAVRETIPIPHSLGWFYAAFTAYFGFTPYRHEGKLMGLAALGHERAASNPWPERLSRVLDVRGGSYEVDPTFTRLGHHSFAERFTDKLAELVTGFDADLPPVLPDRRGAGNGGGAPYLGPGYVDLAFGVQRKLEEAALAVAEDAARRFPHRRLCVSGGVGLNCKLNGALLASGLFDEVFVQPASHDAGTALGAAMVVAEAAGDPIRNTLAHAHFGPAFTNADVARVLGDCKLAAQECSDVAARVADELARGKLVGWFQDGMELGPRALGGRSILANPALRDARERLNRVKHREPWRPFCPSLLCEEKGRYLEGARAAPFMATTFRVAEARRAEMEQVVHADGSTRPQTVARESSPLFHRLLERFRDRTGLPFVVNTSFNVDGEPIVCTPIEALRCFYSSGLDSLAIGDFLLTKT